jgi:hypothetical protein
MLYEYRVIEKIFVKYSAENIFSAQSQHPKKAILILIKNLRDYKKIIMDKNV